ncbi:MAG: branched-chain amino acid transporter permease [Enterovirga sp.]|jgi:branched-chain amino acid transport system permease protein|nr:branched-chain amino acid transporter permease [Enterovirga sp.]
MKRFGPGESVAAILLALAALSPFVLPSQAWIGFAVNAVLISVLAIAWNVTGGFCGQMSFGHAALYGTGAYAAAMLQIRLGLNPYLAAASGVAAGAAMGGLIGALAFRYGLRGSYFALVTLAFAEVLRILASSFEITGAGSGLTLPFKPGLADLQFPDRYAAYLFVLALCIAALAVSAAVKGSRLGSNMIAVRENEEAAGAIGIDAFRVKVIAMTISGAIAGAAGVAYLQIQLFVDAPIAYGSLISVEALLGPIIGGAGTLLGPIIGTIVLHIVGEVVKNGVGGAPGLNLVFYGIVLLLILRFLPNGLMGLAGRLRRPAPAAAAARTAEAR